MRIHTAGIGHCFIVGLLVVLCAGAVTGCESGRLLGEVCARDSECVAGAQCRGGVCVAPLNLGPPSDGDAAPDVEVDATTDALAEAAPDVAEDVTEDTSEEAASDAAEDAAEDASEEAASDAAEDAAEDVAEDVADDTADAG